MIAFLDLVKNVNNNSVASRRFFLTYLTKKIVSPKDVSSEMTGRVVVENDTIAFNNQKGRKGSWAVDAVYRCSDIVR